MLTTSKYESTVPLQQEDQEALHDMVARRNPPGDVGNASPQMLFLQIPDEGQGTSERLKSMCRGKGIRLQFVDVKEDWGTEFNDYADKFR